MDIGYNATITEHYATKGDKMDITKPCRDLNELLPEVKKGAELFLEECKKQGLNVLVTETYRSQARQDWLYEQGRTRAGKKVTWTKKSKHTSRRAFDICKNVRGKEYDNSDGFFKRCADIAVSIGFTAGYYWDKQDMPHIQLDIGSHIKKSTSKGGSYMKRDVNVVFEGKMEKLQLIEDGGHKYIKIQDLWKFGYKIEGNESQVIIKK